MSTLRITPPDILNGQVVKISGQVLGKPMLPGKTVQLEKWTGNRWSPFHVLHTDANGRWSNVEPINSVGALAVFRLRALVTLESGFPYAPGGSPTRTLCVQGIAAGKQTCEAYRQKTSKRHRHHRRR